MLYCAMGLALLVTLLASISPVTALLCYEKNPDDPYVKLRNSSDFEFCVMSPDNLDKDTGLSLFGVGEKSDSAATYRKIFNLATPPYYKVLSLCLFEKYSIGSVEFVLRCLCQEDRCNKAANLESFLDRLAAQEMEK